MAERKTLESLVIETRPRVYLTPVLESFKDGYRIHHIESGSIASGARDTFVPLRHVSKQKRRIFELEDDNAKLRELITDMWRFTGTACKKYPRLFDPAAQGGQMVQPNSIDLFEQRIRELGIGTDK